jgi:hypothetical protein
LDFRFWILDFGLEPGDGVVGRKWRRFAGTCWALIKEANETPAMTVASIKTMRFRNQRAA